MKDLGYTIILPQKKIRLNVWLYVKVWSHIFKNTTEA